MDRNCNRNPLGSRIVSYVIILNYGFDKYSLLIYEWTNKKQTIFLKNSILKGIIINSILKGIIINYFLVKRISITESQVNTNKSKVCIVWHKAKNIEYSMRTKLTYSARLLTFARRRGEKGNINYFGLGWQMDKRLFLSCQTRTLHVYNCWCERQLLLLLLYLCSKLWETRVRYSTFIF